MTQSPWWEGVFLPSVTHLIQPQPKVTQPWPSGSCWRPAVPWVSGESAVSGQVWETQHGRTSGVQAAGLRIPWACHLNWPFAGQSHLFSHCSWKEHQSTHPEGMWGCSWVRMKCVNGCAVLWMYITLRSVWTAGDSVYRGILSYVGQLSGSNFWCGYEQNAEGFRCGRSLSSGVSLMCHSGALFYSALFWGGICWTNAGPTAAQPT